jgi:hypothetical protein
MNPYLEQPSVWADFHNRFVAYVGEALSVQVRPNFMVKLEECVFIHEPSGEKRRKQLARPDIALLEGSPVIHAPIATTSPKVRDKVDAVLASLTDVDMERHTYIEIRDRQNRELVTMIEILSPSIKRYGPDRDQYVMKRTSLMFGTASLVEIDLLRGGPRFPLTDLPPSDYCVAIYRKPLLPQVEAWPIGLRDPLPVIPIPLKGDFPDATLDLQAVLHRVYDAAGYEDYIYESSPEPPLEGPDLAWAQSILST